MIESKPPKKWIRDTQRTLEYGRTGPGFIKDHELWKGFGQYKWLIKGGIIIVAILSIDIISSIPDLFNGQSLSMDRGANANSGFSLSSMEQYLGGGVKYLLLIGIEIIIFHFTRQTLMRVTGEPIPTDFKTFIGAEKRMIKVAIFSYVMETVFHVLSNTVLGIFGLGSIKLVMLFLIQSFYLGFALVDNYNELFDMTLAQSHRYTWHFAPVAILTGAIVNLLMNIPVLGIIAGTVVCSVIATLTMHELTKKEDGLDWAFVEKKKRKKKMKTKK